MCKEAKADLAFLVDGSWSIGDDNFMKITRFLSSTVGSLDLIGQDGTQVSNVSIALPIPCTCRTHQFFRYNKHLLSERSERGHHSCTHILSLLLDVVMWTHLFTHLSVEIVHNESVFIFWQTIPLI